MALSPKLELRQGQSLVMTPQLQQAIKLLQLSNIELTEYVEGELERNPLLERNENAGEPEERRSMDAGEQPPAKDANASEEAGGQDEEWLDLTTNQVQRDTETVFDTETENVFPESVDPGPTPGLNGWTGTGTGSIGGADSDYNLEAFVADELTLQDHLTAQLQLAISDPVRRMIGDHLIDMADEDGYMRGEMANLADRLGAPIELVEETLATLQTFEPAGVMARNLAECLTLQLKDRNRFDPVIETFIANLDLIAKRDLAGLKRACGVGDEDLADMITEIKSLEPKPGLKFGQSSVQPVVPDVFVRQRPDSSWLVELNNDTLPKVLVNQAYYATVSKTAKLEKDKTYLHDCFQTANWLVKSLDQRARTILKVAKEIVKQQDGFLTHGVQYLRPLNLKMVADAIEMHESTVSRVTSNKYMATPRGTFELKYFFTSAIASSGAGEAHSSEAVRHRIKQLVDNESASSVLSDDKIVELLGAEGIEIARRTVAKYRESMRIPSSVERRREKKMALSVSS
ncbi:MAG: RNA polymerase factor sigma-54 [Pseudomonadota bacterium]